MKINRQVIKENMMADEGDDTFEMSDSFSLEDADETEVSGVAAEPTKVTLASGEVVLVSTGDKVTVETESVSKIKKINKNK